MLLYTDSIFISYIPVKCLTQTYRRLNPEKKNGACRSNNKMGAHVLDNEVTNAAGNWAD